MLHNLELPIIHSFASYYSLVDIRRFWNQGARGHVPPRFYCYSIQSIVLHANNVTGFAKRGLIHVSNFATLMSHNFVCD